MDISESFNRDVNIKSINERISYILTKIQNYDKILNDLNDFKVHLEKIKLDNDKNSYESEVNKSIVSSHSKNFEIFGKNLSDLENKTVGAINDFFYTVKTLSDKITDNQNDFRSQIEKAHEQIGLISMDKDEKINSLNKSHSGSVFSFLDYFHRLEENIKSNFENMMKEKETLQKDMNLKMDEISKEIARIKNSVFKISEQVKNNDNK